MRIFTSAAPLPNAKSERLAVYDTYQICAWIFRFGIAFAIAVLADIYLRIFTTAMFGKAGKKYADKIAQHVSVFRLRGVFVLVLLAFIDFGSRRVSRLLSVFFSTTPSPIIIAIALRLSVLSTAPPSIIIVITTLLICT